MKKESSLSESMYFVDTKGKGVLDSEKVKQKLKEFIDGLKESIDRVNKCKYKVPLFSQDTLKEFYDEIDSLALERFGDKLIKDTEVAEGEQND